MSYLIWAAIAYVYIAGIHNGLLIIGFDRELNDGNWASPRKVIFATVLWPLLMPFLFIKGGFSK